MLVTWLLRVSLVDARVLCVLVAWGLGVWRALLAHRLPSMAQGGKLQQQHHHQYQQHHHQYQQHHHQYQQQILLHFLINALRDCLRASSSKSSWTAWGKEELLVMLQTWHIPFSHLLHLG